jgi:hypothetical protein
VETVEVEYDDERRMKPPPSADELREAWLRDLWLDNALEETFPASDPIASGLFD